MMTVTGTREGIAYVAAVRLPTDGPETMPALRARMPGASVWAGLVFGTQDIIDALSAADGERVPLTPTGPDVTLTSGLPETVLAWLVHHTDVTGVHGAPAPAEREGGPATDGRVY